MRRAAGWSCIIAVVALLAVCITRGASAGVVFIEVTCSGPVCLGCDFTLTLRAFDCDYVHPSCCWDDLNFPDWGGPSPQKQGDGTYYAEWTTTCNWIGPQDFTFHADDLVSCSQNPEDDDPGEATVTVVGVEVTGIEGPVEPICPGWSAGFTAETNPPGNEALLTWTGGEDPPTGQGSAFFTHWHTSGQKTVTVKCGSDACGSSSLNWSVNLLQPVHEVRFLEPTGTVGGIAPIQVETRKRCAEMQQAYLALKEREVTDIHTTDWVEFLGPDDSTSSYDPIEKITTTVYTWYWDTTQVHDGSHELQANVTFVVEPDWQLSEHETLSSTTVSNLALTTVTPEGVAVWKGEEGATVPISVSYTDNDLGDPVTIVVSMYDTVGPTLVGCMSAGGVTSGSHTFNWDGFENAVEPGPYTYEVDVSQLDDSGVYPVLDSASYRSLYLEILRAEDEYGNPIYEAEYDGYDDNGTPEDESDDNYIYIIRYYKLRDGFGKEANEGYLWMYDPTLERKASWSIPSLECIIHSANDGLVASVGGTQHALRVPVPTSAMQYAGDYRFVLHIRDDHRDKYRDHRRRWAKELNSAKRVPGMAIWTQSGTPILSDTRGLGRVAEQQLKKVSGASKHSGPGYFGYHPLGDPQHGGSGVMLDVRPRYTIRTLNRLSPDECESWPCALEEYCTKNTVWAYYGHANTSVLLFNREEPGIVCAGGDDPASERYDIYNFDLRHVRLVFLAGCKTAGEKGDPVPLAWAFTQSLSNPNGAKASVGIVGSVRLTALAFRKFNKLFWKYMCKGEMNVEDALDNAWRESKPAVNWTGWHPACFGDPKTVLYPPD